MATKDSASSFPAPYGVVPPPRPPSDVFNLDNKVSPSVLLVIVVLAIIFFVSGLLHMLVRLFLRPAARDHYDLDSVSAFQGQLQQLFHLHDAGLDQHFVDTLPLFQYKTLIGADNQFDCAVCLCEFEPEDKLRLLPKCSHAFHMECIDAWLLSHSTCPLCRASLIPEFIPLPRTPLLHLLESRTETDTVERNTPGSTENSLPDSNVNAVLTSEGRLVAVKLGRYQMIDMGEENKGKGSVRRCYSMGSFEYVMEENSHLKVQVRTPTKKQPILPLLPGRRPAMSERYPESRVLQAFDGFNSPEELRKSAPKEGGSSRTAHSFRFHVDDEESQCNSIKESSSRTPSFACRTLHWLAGRQHKISSSAS